MEWWYAFIGVFFIENHKKILHHIHASPNEIVWLKNKILWDLPKHHLDWSVLKLEFYNCFKSTITGTLKYHLIHRII